MLLEKKLINSSILPSAIGARKNLTFSARVLHRYSWGVLHFGINLAIAGEDIRINSMLPAMIGWHREDFNSFFEFNLSLFMALEKTLCCLNCSILPAMIGWNREDFFPEFVYGFGKDFVLLCVGKKY